MRRLLAALLLAFAAAGCATTSATSSSDDVSMLPPLYYWNMSRERFWAAAGLVGLWKDSDYKLTTHWLLPLYFENKSGFYSLPYTRTDFDSRIDNVYLCGLAGSESTPLGYSRSWLAPLFYHDTDGLMTPLYGNWADADWLLPFYYRDMTDFHTLLWSVRKDEKTGEEGFVSLPFLYAEFSNTNTCERSRYALLGLAGAKQNAAASRYSRWFFPFYSYGTTHYVTVEKESDRRQDIDKTELGVFLWLYGYERTVDRMTLASSACHSVLWRLFRYKCDVWKGCELDLLFIPVWR